MDLFISKETLNMLSYKSTLGRSLKQISLRETPLQNILEDIERYRASYIDILIQDNLAYPIEIQLWCGEDYLFNIWSHRYIYKYKEAEIGKLLYKEYTAKIICCEQGFIERLKYWEGELNGR